MQTVVGIRFKKAGKIYYFHPGELPIAVGDNCIVETSRGVEYGEVVVPPKDVPEDEVVQPLKQVIRVATDEDREHAAQQARRAKEAFAVALERIAAHGLPMKLVDAEYTFDDSKLLFYFTADGRVDFRELVKDLAAIFRIRIELRQIGVRDEAKMIGGLGSCGRPLCCATFLGDFAPVSIKMAKEQNLSLNPSKISGICGRLMCCLRYESEVYKTHKSLLGDGCPGCGHSHGRDLLMADEFFSEVEDEEDFYSDLLKEDTIQPVDYELMREAAEVEERPLISDERSVSERPASEQKETRKGAGKRKRKPKRRGTPQGEAAPPQQKAVADEQKQEKPKRKAKRPRRKRKKPPVDGSGAPEN
ncbi:MAG TPA: stage 0 sporulation family protein [Firmicutes bacterium]|nr:stage 0 sporulation family protein [Bacillota bacterium]